MRTLRLKISELSFSEEFARGDEMLVLKEQEGKHKVLQATSV